MSVFGILLPVIVTLDSCAANVGDYAGTPQALRYESGDDEDAQRFAAAIYLEMDAGSPAGTVQAVILTSDDGAHWQAVAASSILNVPGASVYEVIECAYLLKFVALYVVTSTGAQIHTCRADFQTNMRAAASPSGGAAPVITWATIPAAAGVTDKAGIAVVGAGNVFVDVGFATPMPTAAYAVVAMPETNVVAWITNRTAAGFRINISAPLGAPINVGWIAQIP